MVNQRMLEIPKMRKFVMTNKSNYRQHTILDDAKPMSEEERQQGVRSERERWLKEDAEKWVENLLNEIYHLAILNENIARALCERAAHRANGNTELTDLIKEKLTRSEKGRPKNTLPDWLFLLHYAHAMIEYKYDRKKSIEYMIDYVFRMQGVMLGARTIDTRISEKVTAYREGNIKFPPEFPKFPDWVESVIQARIARGDKNRKRN